MAGRYVVLPSGKMVYTQSGASDEQVAAWAGERTAPAQTERSPFSAGLDAAYTGVRHALPMAVRSLNGVQTLDEITANDQDLAAMRASAARQEKLLPGGPAGLDQGVWPALKENFLYSTPQMGAQAIGGIGGFVAGGPVGSALGVAAVGTPFYVGSNADRATDSGRVGLTRSAAQRSVAMAPVQGALDAGIEAVLPGVGHGFNGNLLTRVVKGAAEGAAIEGATEALQQGGERYAAGLSLTDSQAMDEYKQSAAIGGLLGGAFGGVGGAFNRAHASSPTVNLPAHEVETSDLLRGPNLSSGIFEESEPGSQGRLFDSGVDAPRDTPGTVEAPRTHGEYVEGQGDLFARTPTAEVPSMVQTPRDQMFEHITGGDKTHGAWSGKLVDKVQAAIAKGDPDAIDAVLETERAKPLSAKAQAIREPQIERAQAVADHLRDMMSSARQQEADQAAAQAPGLDYGAVAENNQLELERGIAARQQEQQAAQQAQAQQQAAAQQQQMVLDNRAAMFGAELTSKDPGGALKGFLKWVSSGKGEHGPAMMLPHEREMYQQAMQRIRRQQDMKAALDERAFEEKMRAMDERARAAQVKTQAPKSSALKREDVRVTPSYVREARAEKAPPPAKAAPSVIERPATGPTPRAVAPAKPAEVVRKAPKQVKETVGDRIKREVAAKRKETPRAAEARSKPEGRVSEHRGADERLAQDRADRSVETEKPGSREEAGTGNRAEQESTQALTYQDVTDRAVEAEQNGYLSREQGMRVRSFINQHEELDPADKRRLTPDQLNEVIDKAVAKSADGTEPGGAKPLAQRDGPPDRVRYGNPEGAKTFLRELGLFSNKELMDMSGRDAIDAASRMGIDKSWIDYFEGSRLKAWGHTDMAPAQPNMSKYMPEARKALDKIRNAPSSQRGDLRYNARYNPELAAKLDRMTHLLRPYLTKMGLDNVSLWPAPRLTDENGNNIRGEYDPALQLISVALQRTPEDMVHTLHHETIHHLRAVRLFTGVEWARLEAAAQKNKTLMDWAKKNYPTETAEKQTEEAVAQMFADWVQHRAGPPQVRPIFQKLMDFLHWLRKAIYGAGFKDAEEVFEAIVSGRIGGRPGSPMLAKGVPKLQTAETSIIERLPSDLQKPALHVVDTLRNAMAKLTIGASFTEDVVDRGVTFIPSLKDFVDISNRKVVLKSRLEDAHNQVMQAFQKLDRRLQGVGEGTVNGLIQQSTASDKWAFKPDWVKGDVEIDPELAAKFDALPVPAQEVVKDVFRIGHDMLLRRKASATQSVTGTYDALIKGTDDPAEKKRLESERKSTLAEYSRLFDISGTLPYASLRRYGDYIVVGKSRELMDAIAQGADSKQLEALKGDERHYFVDRYETYAEAAAKARELETLGRYEKLVYNEVDKAADEMVGGREMMLAFQRLREYIKQQAPGMNASEKTSAALDRLAADLYLSALKSTSARKSELKRLGVAADNLDMMRNFITQGRADAHLVAAMDSNEALLDTMSKMRKEAGAATNPDAMRVYNEVMLRHMAGMAYTPSRLADNIKNATSIYMLATSPAYYMQNLTQPSMSVAYMAGEHGLARSWRTMLSAYKEIAQAWKGTGALGALNLDNLSDDVRQAIHDLADRGAIDIGLEKDMGEFHSLSKGPVATAWARVSTALRAASRKSESINRVATAAAAYRMAVERGKSHSQAVDYAYKVNRITHGSYDGFNAPMWTRGPWLSTLTQFKKFQLMQVSLLARMMHNAINNADPVERAMARRAMIYTLGHTGALAGLLGMPGASALMWAINGLFGSDDEPEDIEQQMRDAIGDEATADLLLKGLPTAAHVDVSSRIGMGQAFSLIPFAEPDFTREGYEKAFTAMAGPFFGGLLPKVWDGMGMIHGGDYYRGLASMLPNGVGNAINATREATSGVTKRNGDVLLTPEEVSYGNTFARVLGLQTTGTAERYRLQAREQTLNEFYKARTSEMNLAYIAARESGDQQAMDDLREQWQSLQAARIANGFERQPFSVLIRAAKAKKVRETERTVGGVQYRSKARAEFMADQQDDGEDEE